MLIYIELNENSVGKIGMKDCQSLTKSVPVSNFAVFVKFL
jgi:hypothetical protein